MEDEFHLVGLSMRTMWVNMPSEMEKSVRYDVFSQAMDTITQAGRVTVLIRLPVRRRILESLRD
jgi:hypothetical protein